jgi:hypothetical protein
MKWTPDDPVDPEEKKLQPVSPWSRFLLGGVTGFLLTYGPWLIQQNNPGGIACIIFGVLGLGFLIVFKQLYGLKKFLTGVVGLVAGVFFTCSYMVNVSFIPPALVALAAGIWAIMEEIKPKKPEGDKDASNPGDTESKG